MALEYRIAPTARAEYKRMKNRILVTGGAGFLGSHLCERLLAEGNEVICADNYFTGSKENVAHLLSNPYFELIRHDVTFPLYIEVDQIYNLACPASPVHYQHDPVQTTKTAVHGSINMLGLAKRTGARILLTSTSEVYGDPLVHPQSEDYWGNVNPNGERSMYDEAKRFAEAATATYARTYSINTKVVRIFNTYGPRMQLNDGRVVTNFIVQALNNENITIYGDGSQTRSFSYVDDTVNGIIALMESDHNDVFNIGNPNEISINELATRIIQLTNSKSKLVNKDLPEDDPKQRRPDINKAKNLLNWEPVVELEDGLIKTIDWVSSQL